MNRAELREAAAQEIYGIMAASDPEGRKYPWVSRGNSDKQNEARKYADAALAVAWLISGLDAPRPRRMSRFEYERDMAKQDGPRSWWGQEFKRNFGDEGPK